MKDKNENALTGADNENEGFNAAFALAVIQNPDSLEGAAKAAGYKGKFASQVAYKALANPRVRSKIEDAIEKKKIQLRLKAFNTLERLLDSSKSDHVKAQIAQALAQIDIEGGAAAGPKGIKININLAGSAQIAHKKLDDKNQVIDLATELEPDTQSNGLEG